MQQNAPVTRSRSRAGARQNSRERVKIMVNDLDMDQIEKVKFIKHIHTLNARIHFLKNNIEFLHAYKTNLNILAEVLYEKRDEIPEGLYLQLMNALVGKKTVK